MVWPGVFSGQATWLAFVFVGLADSLRVDDLLHSRLPTRVPSVQVKISRTVPIKVASLLPVGSTRGGASSLHPLCRSTFHLPRSLPSFGLPCAGAWTLRSPCHGSASVLRQPSGGCSASISRVLLRRHLDSIPDFALRGRFALAPCLIICPGFQRLVFYSTGFLSPASKLDAGCSLDQGC